MTSLHPRKRIRANYLHLYPALKQVTTNKIAFPSPNTREEQLNVRKLLVKRIPYLHNFTVFKTIVLDNRFIKKAWRNLDRSKSIHHVDFFVSEPIVLDLLASTLYKLKKKVIHTLTIHLDIKDTNPGILGIISLIQNFKRLKVLHIIFESSQEAAFLQSLPVIRDTLERSILLPKRTFLDFHGFTGFYSNLLLAGMRYWKSTVTISITPIEIERGQVRNGEALEEESTALIRSRGNKAMDSLKLSFSFLKKFSNETLNKLLNESVVTKEIRNLTLIFNRLELNEERSKMFGNFIKEARGLRNMRLILYYLKYQQMNYKNLLEGLEVRGEQIKELSIGYMAVKKDTKDILIRVISRLEGLESLEIYWDIKEVVESDDLWSFFQRKERLRHVKLVLTCKSSVLEDNGEDLNEKIEKNLRSLFGYLKGLLSLVRLTIMLPEIEVQIGELLNDMIIETQTLESLRVDCEDYNTNYLWELKEISKMKNLVIEINTGFKEDFRNLKVEDSFKVNTYSNSYDHFAEIHEKFYKRYI